VLGIFARLWYRDGKAGYLNDLPLTLQYVVDACAAFPQLRALREFLLHSAVRALPGANAREAHKISAGHASAAACGVAPA
jgi:aminoglycoside/choline kinase family phosphotransferase